MLFRSPQSGLWVFLETTGSGARAGKDGDGVDVHMTVLRYELAGWVGWVGSWSTAWAAPAPSKPDCQLRVDGWRRFTPAPEVASGEAAGCGGQRWC